MCAIALYKRFGRELYYYQHNIEVDFYIPEENMAIQVSYSLSDEKTMKRETDALVKLNKIHPLQKAIILTMSEETTLKVGDIDIAVIPVWKWFLHTQPKSSVGF